MEVTTWSGSVDTGGLSTGAYLKTGHEIKSDGDNPVTRAEYIAVDDDRLDDVLAAIQAAQSACEGQITSISGRVTTAESSISGLDTRVTALEESGGGGSGGTTNYNELTNIPTINGVTVKGNLSAQNLGLANAVDIPTPMVSYGTCTTAAAKAAKVVTLVNADGWTLKTGCMIMVKSSYTNTAQNPTLNVNGSGAKTIIYGSTPITTTYLSYAAESTKQSVFFYNGTSWVWIAHGTDNNTTYSSKDAASEGTATSLCTTGEKYIWNNKYDKPSDGIPKTDLASNVQTSLGKADTALQTHQSYADISDKPSINGITLTGNLSATNLGIANTDEIIADNMVPFPHKTTTDSAYGIDNTVNSDGSVRLSGTCTASNVVYRFVYPNYNEIDIGNSIYIITPGFETSNNCRVSMTIKRYDDTTETVNNITDAYIIDNTLGIYEKITYISVYVTKNTVVDVVAKPMLEKGTIPHKYQPYVMSRQSLLKRIIALENK